MRAQTNLHVLSFMACFHHPASLVVTTLPLGALALGIEKRTQLCTRRQELAVVLNFKCTLLHKARIDRSICRPDSSHAHRCPLRVLNHPLIDIGVRSWRERQRIERERERERDGYYRSCSTIATSHTEYEAEVRKPTRSPSRKIASPP